MELGAAELGAIAAIYVAAGAVKGTIGLGLPTISMALMGIWLPIDQAAAILVLPAFLTNVWQGLFGGALVRLLVRLWPMMVFLVVGTLIATALTIGADTALAGAFLGAILMLYAGLSLGGFAFAVPPRAEPALGPAAGLATGLISGTTGIFVVPAAPYLQALDLGKDGLVQAIGIAALVAIGALALGLGINGGLGPDVALPGAVAVVGAFAGMAAGQSIRARIAVDTFRRWVLIGLLALGAATILRAL